VIAFPQMVMVYKSDKPLVDPNSIEINIPTNELAPPPAAGSAEETKAEGAGNDDLMKSLGGTSDAPKAPEAKIDDANDDLMKSLGGKGAPAAKDEANPPPKPGAPPKGKAPGS
jgi:hypothetical protein